MHAAVNPELKIRPDEEELVMHGTPSEAAGIILRGVLHLYLTEPTKIKSVTLQFTGKMKVSWSDGIGSAQRLHEEEKTVITHDWSFLPSSKKAYLLPPGKHEWPFEVALPGDLPETVEGSDYGKVTYQLKALADRPTFSMNFSDKMNVRITRMLLPSADELMQSMVIANEWANKLIYEIMVPAKAFGEDDTIPIFFKLQPLNPSLKVRWLTCTLKEYCTFSSGEAQKYEGRTLKQIRDEDFPCFGTAWEKTEVIALSSISGNILCDTANDMMKIKHKLKFVISFINPDGHISELRAAVPIIISASKAIDDTNFLPAYEDIWRTLPYDPVILAQLREHVQDQSISPLPHSNWRHSIHSIIPSIGMRTSANQSQSSSRETSPSRTGDEEIDVDALIYGHPTNRMSLQSIPPSYQSVIAEQDLYSSPLPSYELTEGRQEEPVYIKSQISVGIAG